VTNISLENVWHLLRESAGVDESVNLDGDIDHKEFSELGYDSLAVLEIVTRIERQYGIKISGDDMEGLTTPARLVDYVNSRTVTT
jgi:acyl carrier protein